MRVAFTDDGWDDYTYWASNDRRLLLRINRLIEDARRQPFTGIGKPEALKYDAQGAWSRRITDEHRLVYLVADDTLVILQARFHHT